MEEGEAKLVRDDLISNASYGISSESLPQRAGLTWQHCFFMILAYVIGAGVLGLPCTVAKLGWLPAAAAYFAALAGFVLSGSLYVRLFEAVPEAKCLGDVAYKAYGAAGEAAVSLLQSSFMLVFAALLHLTAALSLNEFLARPMKEVGLASSIIAGANFVLLQVDMNSVGLLTAISTVALMLACLVVMVYFGISGRHSGAETEIFANSNWTAWGVACSNLVCAFAGCHIWIELQSESSKPAEFRHAAWSAGIIIAVTYAVLGAFGYYYIGRAELATGHPLTLYVFNGFARRLVGCLIMIHVVPSYVLNGSVLIRNLVGQTEMQRTTKFGRQVRWLCGSAVLVVFGFSASARLPFFNDLAGLCGALFLNLLSYTVPLALSCKLLKLSQTEAASYIFLAVATAIGAVLGVKACIDDMHTQKAALLEFLP
mmetsp:Transcript_42425/g.76177  ORF Transcript_42425/g.76177 Transcript_42425/m.76177 type:complete len:427 (+) Transcript_42425:58-1338(+)